MYYLGNDVVDSIELKCFVVSRGAKVDKQVYQKYGKNTRLNPNPLMCNCMILSDETIVQLTDMSFHLKQLGSIRAPEASATLDHMPCSVRGSLRSSHKPCRECG